MNYQEAYTMLKEALTDLNNDTLNDIVAIIDGNITSEAEPNLLTKDEWNAMGYMQKLELNQTNKEVYEAAVQGQFKGEN